METLNQDRAVSTMFGDIDQHRAAHRRPLKGDLVE